MFQEGWAICITFVLCFSIPILVIFWSTKKRASASNDTEHEEDFHLVSGIGDRIILEGLQNKRYNGQIGILTSFDTERQLYCIRLLSNNNSIFVQGRNINPYPYEFDQERTKLRAIIRVLHDTSTVAEISRALELMDSLETSVCYALTLLSAAIRTRCVTNDVSLRSKIIKRLQSAIKLDVCDRIKASLKVELITFARHQDLPEFGELISSLRERPYGHLPLIEFISTPKQDLIDIYPRIKKLVEHGNYSHSWLNWSSECYTRCIQAYCDAGDISMARSILVIVDKKDKFRLLYNRGVICFAEQNYKNALAFFSEAQEQMSLNVSSSNYEGLLLKSKGYCYVALGDRSRVKECVKNLERMKSREAKALKKCLGTMDAKKKSDFAATGRVKCSNPYCSEIEKELKTFKACAKCKLCFYCSTKCQKKHWKNGHKKHCAK